MSNITVKVALSGEGKTKWLLDVANHYSDTHDVRIITNNEQEYFRFCEKYFSLYNHICPVLEFNAEDVTDKTVVLIDDVFNKHTLHVSIASLQATCAKVFVTVEGQLA